MPGFVAALPRENRAHTADPIDFAGLRGRVVAVMGAGASALDNAACALEHGAAEVHLFCRRDHPQLDQSYRWLTFAGFLRRLSNLDDAWRWRFMSTEALRDDRLARYPYLSADYGLTERCPGETPWITDIHLFSIASTMSFGPSGSSINAMTTAVPKLVSGLTRGLFQADLDRHWAEFSAYDTVQTVL